MVIHDLKTNVMKKNVYLLATLLAVASMAFTSCKSSFYQVYDVNSSSLKQQDNSMVYENNDLKVMYNLWGKNGEVGFIVQNKTDKNLYVDLNQTFFVLNGEALDYYKAREFTSSRSAATSTNSSFAASFLSAVGFWPTRYFVPTTASASTGSSKVRSNGVTTKEKQILCLPPHTYKTVSEYTVSPKVVKTCNKALDFPKTTATAASYSEAESPVQFTNILAYSFDKECKDVQRVQNDFYVSNVTNYSEEAAVEKVKEKVDCYDRSKKKVSRFKIGGPNKFYRTYMKSHGTMVVE